MSTPKISKEEMLKIVETAMQDATVVAKESYTRQMLEYSAVELHNDLKLRALQLRFVEFGKTRKAELVKRIPVEWDHSPPAIDLRDESYQKWAYAWFEASTIAAEKNEVGNCESLALLTMKYFLKHNLNINVELLTIANDKNSGLKKDHVFLVIGRDPLSDPSNISSWGSDSLICDPWTQKVYPANKENMRQNLEYITEKLSESGAVQTLQKFDPDTDRIILMLSNTIIHEKQEQEKRNTEDLKNMEDELDRIDREWAEKQKAEILAEELESKENKENKENREDKLSDGPGTSERTEEAGIYDSSKSSSLKP